MNTKSMIQISKEILLLILSRAFLVFSFFILDFFMIFGNFFLVHLSFNFVKPIAKLQAKKVKVATIKLIRTNRLQK